MRDRLAMYLGVFGALAVAGIIVVVVVAPLLDLVGTLVDRNAGLVVAAIVIAPFVVMLILHYRQRNRSTSDPQ